MPIQRTYQQSDIEKRLKLLKVQLYGKYEKAVSKHPEISHATDLTYLKQDLRKITILSLLAVAAQFFLFFSQLPNKIKLF